MINKYFIAFMNRFLLLFLMIGSVVLAFEVKAVNIRPAVVYDKSGKFDKSFNEAVFSGVKRFISDTGIKVRDFEPTNEAQIEQGLRKLAKLGNSPIVAVGFGQANAVRLVARDYPKIKFTIIDGYVDEPNVQSISFREHEGSFLMGVLAAMKSSSHKIGFIGGMDIPLISRFACGYAQGAKYEDPNIELLYNMVGSTPSAWNNPSRAGELARSQIESGVDVIYSAAGGSGIGVYQVASDLGKYAIGVDSNQNHLHPGTMLTAMVKRVDNAVYSSYKMAMEENWKGGSKVMGLSDGGVDWAIDQHNRHLITAAMEKSINIIKKKIIKGDIIVHDYMSNNTCIE